MNKGIMTVIELRGIDKKMTLIRIRKKHLLRQVQRGKGKIKTMAAARVAVKRPTLNVPKRSIFLEKALSQAVFEK